MRIHSDIIAHDDIYLAAREARVTLDTLASHGSRSRKYAYEIILSGESKRAQNGGQNKAATWDQWGVFFNALYNIDPNLKCWAYKDADDFDSRTGHRFQHGWPADAHGDHTFRFKGILREQSCTKCSAVVRWES